MVFEQRPDEIFLEVVQRSLGALKTVIEGASTVIRTGDSAIQELDNALTGSRPKFGETPQETFGNVLEMLEATLVEAREKGSAAAPSVTQRARSILGRINEVEPAWKTGPSSMRTTADVFRGALRDLRASNALIKLAQGRGSLEDLEGLSKWAEDLNTRIEQVKAGAAPQAAAEPAQPKKPKKDTTPKTKPKPDEVRFALAVAEECGDKEVKAWAQEFASGKISEKQWVSRLTSHAASGRDSLDDVFDRANARVARENNANQV